MKKENAATGGGGKGAESEFWADAHGQGTSRQEEATRAVPTKQDKARKCQLAGFRGFKAAAWFPYLFQITLQRDAHLVHVPRIAVGVVGDFD